MLGEIKQFIFFPLGKAPCFAITGRKTQTELPCVMDRAISLGEGGHIGKMPDLNFIKSVQVKGENDEYPTDCPS